MTDYTVITKDGQEGSFETLKEAKAYAATVKDREPFIDQSKDYELTGVYWTYENGKLVKKGTGR